MNKNFEIIRERLDWVHDTDGYCVKYWVREWTATWSTGKYWMVEGLTAKGSLVDLGTFEQYRDEYKWLAALVGEHTA
jgi:hypothetical protein